ncbi:MAG: autotransporter domain-containing protein, partial [Croceibacterium sp.]
NFFAGSTLVTGGTLSVNGALGGATHSMTLSGGAALGGSGRIGGTVTVADGTVAPGNSPGTLAFANNLALGSASILNFELGSPTGTAGVASDLITVARNLTLDGTLNVTNVGGFGGGLYRLLNYGGTLTNNGLDIGLTPTGFAAGDLTVQTATAGQVNLLVAAAAPTSFTFWDGAGTGADNIISGGTGTWDATRTNWTVSDGKFNGAYDRAGMLIFGAEAQSGGVLTTIGGPRAAAAPLLDRRFTVTVDAGQGAIAIANGATLSGTAGMQFAANGYLLTGADLVLGGFTTVRVGDGTTAGAGFIAEIANNITGAGLLWKDDLGTLILSGTNSHTGGTRVRKGTLVGDTDSLQGRVEIDGALIINQVQNGRFTGQLFGEGTLAKEGAGTLTYDVTDVVETFEGPITINAGRFIIGGNTLGGSVTVNNTATLGGTARGLGSLFVRSGGTLAPGNSIGQLTVSSATFDAGSIFQVELNDGGSVPGVNNDLLLVDGGDVRINGGTVHVSPANGTDTGATYASGTRYRIISTDDGGEVTGTFDTLTDDFAFLNFTLSYGNEDVFLTSALAKSTFCLGGMTFNQCSTGEGAFSIGSGAVFDALLNLTDAEAPVALDALSGEVHASARTMLLEDSRFPREAVLARLGSADSGAGAWGHAFGSRGHWDSDGNAGRADRDIDGFFTGIDAPLGQNARAGLMGGYTHTKVEIGSRGSTGSVDSWHLGAYGGGQWGGLGVRLGGAVAWHNLATTRAIAFRGFTDAATDSYDARTGQLFAEAAYRVEVRDLTLEPFAQVAWVNLTSSDYAEQGGAAALSGGNDSLDASFSTIGLRGETVLGGKLRLTGSGAWRHAFSALAERTPFTTHAFAGSDDFTIAGLPVARNALAVDAGLVLDLSDNARLSATYSGQAGSSLSDHGGKVGLSIRF